MKRKNVTRKLARLSSCAMDDNHSPIGTLRRSREELETLLSAPSDAKKRAAPLPKPTASARFLPR